MTTTRIASWSSILSVACGFLAAGCSSDDGKPPAQPIAGECLFRGQEPCVGALVVFHPLGTGKVEVDRPNGIVKDDGTFTLTTYKEGDGAPEGEYGVTVVWNKAKKAGKFVDSERSPTTPDLLGGRYGDPQNTKLKVTVVKGENRPKLVVE